MQGSWAERQTRRSNRFATSLERGLLRHGMRRVTSRRRLDAPSTSTQGPKPELQLRASVDCYSHIGASMIAPFGANKCPYECRRPATLSIAYMTKRPGGIDILLNSLAQQTSKDYELIIVDALAPIQRATAIKAMADSLGVNLRCVRGDKRRTRALHHRFGYNNAYRARTHANQRKQTAHTRTSSHAMRARAFIHRLGTRYSAFVLFVCTRAIST